MATKTVDDQPALLIWAHEMSQHHTGNWRLAAKDVVEMLSMPSIVVGVHFEADLGQYFEVTMKWHAHPGELSTRPGFRVMELHQLCFDCIAPFWEEARLNPRTHLERTQKHVDTEVDESDRRKKREQIEKGVSKGHAELVKMAKYLMSPPLSFNILLNNKLGRHFARALVAAAEENGIDFPNDNGERWDPSIFSVERERPKQEQAFYEMMRDEPVDVTHWCKQIGFNQTDVHPDLKKLTMEEQGSRDITLLAFRSQHPVMFSALHATFALMPSTTQLTEQSHGALRDSLPVGVSMKFTDARQTCMTNEEHCNREDIRSNERQETGATNLGVKHDDTKAKQIQSAAATTKKSKQRRPSVIRGILDSVKAERNCGPGAEKGRES